MDAAFDSYCLLTRRWRPATLKAMKRRLRWLQERGLVLDPFSVEQASAVLVAQLAAGCTVNSYNSQVRAVKAWAEFRGLDSRSIRAQPPPKSSYKFLTPKQVQACLEYTHPNRRVEIQRRALLTWALKSAMRVSEVAAMNLSDLDTVTRPPRFHVAHPAKRGRKRWLPIETWVLSPKRSMGAYLTQRQAPEGDVAALWVSQVDNHGKPAPAHRFTTDGLRGVMADCSRDLGFKVNFTITRHTRATELRRQGWDLLAVQHYLGHSDIKSTAIYAAVTADDLSTLISRKGSTDPFQTGGDA